MCKFFPIWQEEILVMLRWVNNFESSTQVEEFSGYFFRYILKDSWMERKPYHCLLWVCLFYLHEHVPASTTPANIWNMLILSSPFYPLLNKVNNDCNEMSILRSPWIFSFFFFWSKSVSNPFISPYTQFIKFSQNCAKFEKLHRMFCYLSPPCTYFCPLNN